MGVPEEVCGHTDSFGSFSMNIFFGRPKIVFSPFGGVSELAKNYKLFNFSFFKKVRSE